MVAHNDSLVNVSAAVLLRQMFYKQVGVTVTRPTVSVKETLTEARMALVRQFRGARKYSSAEFLRTYSGSKHTRYLKAISSLAVRPVQANDAHVSAFLKYEKVDQGSVPRVISPRSYRYLAAVGKYLKAYEGPLYSSLRRMFGETVVMKGLNSFDQGRLMHRKWSARRNPVAISIDASRFDQHVSDAMLRWEHSVWLALALPSDRARLSKLLSWQLKNRVKFVSEGTLYRYTLDGQRMSGDMNTGSGNCMIMCSMVYAYMASLGLYPSDYGLADNGDDAVLFVEAKDEERIRSGIADFFGGLGFRMKVEESVRIFERVEFCQTQPVWAGQWTMQRSFTSVISKDGLNMNRIQTLKELRAWAHGVGVAGVSLASGVPVFQSLYLMYQHVGLDTGSRQDLRLGGLSWLSRGLSRGPSTVSDNARVSFWRAFGLEPIVQRDLELRLQTVETLSWGDDGLNRDPLVPAGL